MSNLSIMKHHHFTTRQKEIIVIEFMSGVLSYDELAAKYSVSSRTIRRWVQAHERNSMKVSERNNIEYKKEEEEESDIGELREKLKKVKLHNMLLEELLLICKEQYGIDPRKKTGAKQS